MIQMYKKPYPNKLAIVEYTESAHLLHAFTDSKHLYTVSSNSVLSIYLLDDIIKQHNPTEE